MKHISPRNCFDFARFWSDCIHLWYFQYLLRRSGYGFHTSSELEVVRQIKESACFVVFNAAENEHKTISKCQYTLPDGTVLEVNSRPLPFVCVS